MLTPSEFGSAIAFAFTKRADAMYDKYQASGHAGSMSYEDWSEANAEPAAAGPPSTPQVSPKSPASTPQVKPPMTPSHTAPPGMQYNAWTNQYHPIPEPPKPTSSMWESLTQWRPWQPSWAGRLNPSNYKFTPPGQR